MNDDREIEDLSKTNRKRRKSNLWLNRPKKIRKYYTTPRSITNDVKTPISTAKNTVSSQTLLQAPKKKQKKIVVAGKKKLFDNCETGNVVDELFKIIQSIVTRLRKEGMLTDFVTFLRLINEDKLLPTARLGIEMTNLNG